MARMHGLESIGILEIIPPQKSDTTAVDCLCHGDVKGLQDMHTIIDSEGPLPECLMEPKKLYQNPRTCIRIDSHSEIID